MSNPLPIRAEYGECKHCEGAIIRWPDEPGPFGKRWIHNPAKGFRYYHCHERSTVAEPK